MILNIIFSPHKRGTFREFCVQEEEDIFYVTPSNFLANKNEIRTFIVIASLKYLQNFYLGHDKMSYFDKITAISSLI